MAPTKPAAAKGRGRPKKSDSPEGAAPTSVKKAAAATSADEATPAKRGRGRPSVGADAVIGSKVAKKAAAPSGRGRGRPPKDPNAPKAPKYVPTGKPRGRPAGSGKKQKAAGKKAAAAAGETAPKKADKVSRGGPAKARVSNAAKEVEDEDVELSQHQDDEEELGEDLDMDDDKVRGDVDEEEGGE